MHWKIFLLFFFSFSASAGVFITQEVSLAGAGEARKLTAVFYFEETRIRMELGKDEKQKSITIVDAKTETVTNIVPNEKNYFQVPLDDVRAQIKKNIEVAIEGLKAELKRGTNANRKAEVERAIAQISTNDYRFKKNKSGVKKGTWTCDTYEVLAGAKGPSIGEICAIPLKKLGLDTVDFKAMDIFGVYLMKSFGGLVSGLKTYGELGFPVWTESRGALTTVFLTTKIERRKLSASLFEIPKEYKNVGPLSRQDD